MVSYRPIATMGMKLYICCSKLLCNISFRFAHREDTRSWYEVWFVSSISFLFVLKLSFLFLFYFFFFLLQVVLRNSCYLFIFIKGESDLYTRTCAQPQLYICEIKICSNKTYFQHTTIFKTMLVIYVKNVLQ